MGILWRIVKRRRGKGAFDGEGARIFGGRWNSPGKPAVYTSSSKSLALLELLVHLDTVLPLPQLIAFAFEIEDRFVETLAMAKLPSRWRTSRGIAATQRMGDAWLESGRSLALAVPSVIVPEELNYILNPAHPGFATLEWGKPSPIELDHRLI